MKTRGYLTHPNNNVYTIIKLFETCFEKFADSSSVFEDTYEQLLQNNQTIQWECTDHKNDIIADMYVLYITMRMRQHSYARNVESNQKNKYKKKLAKLVST